MLFSAGFEVNDDEFRVRWDGKKWNWCGRKYRSLRILKSKPFYKIEKAIAKELSKQIMLEIDNDIINRIKAYASIV